MSIINREPLRLGVAEAAALRRAVEAQRPEFGPRLTAGGLTTQLIVQPWFRRHRIVEVQSAPQFPSVEIHVAFPEDNQCGVLTGNLAVFEAMRAGDPPPRLSSHREALIYLNVVDAWTTESGLGELVLTSLDDIPWFDGLDEVESMMIEDLAEQLEGDIAEPTLTPTDDGWRLVKWILTACQLLRRELHTTTDGRVTRTDELVDDNLPCPPGRVWGLVDGRLVPTG